PATAFVHLGTLGRDAAAELVGREWAGSRVDELYARSKGHPLFLTELAQQAAGAEMPASLVESVSARCDELGPAGLLLRTAAVIGPDLDVDLLAAVLGRPAVALLDDAEQPVAKQFLVEADGMFRFRHELVREALQDVERAAPAGPAALEVGAWASYFGRDFTQAAQFAEDGALAAGDTATRARCLAAGGRTHHAAGDLARAEMLLGEAFSLAEGADRVAAAGWLGVLRAHQSRMEEALALLRPAARGQIGVEHTSA